MGKPYRRLQASEREEISRGLGQGLSLRHIAGTIGRPVSTVSREVREGSGNRWNYRAMRGHRRAWRRARTRRQGKSKLERNPRLREVVFEHLRLKWSPEQIAHRLRQAYPEDSTMRISHEAIYTYLYVLPKGTFRYELMACLRRGRPRRRRRHVYLNRPVKRLEDMVSIVERPAEADDRTVVGHWEGDLLIGGNRQSALGSLVERSTRRLILVPIKSKNADEVCSAFSRALKRIPEYARRTLTYDQGREMAEHKRLAQETQVKVYFAHPASPWERGTNESTNGLIRQFFPKGTDFNRVPPQEIRRVQHLLNGRPRKVLDFKTPDEAWLEALR